MYSAGASTCWSNNVQVHYYFEQLIKLVRIKRDISITTTETTRV